jgi:hypothetical protein
VLTSTNHPPYDLPADYQRVPRDMSLWRGETSSETLLPNLDSIDKTFTDCWSKKTLSIAITNTAKNLPITFFAKHTHDRATYHAACANYQNLEIFINGH